MELPLLNVLSGQNPREIAAQVLSWRQSGGGEFVENLLEKALARAQLSSSDRGLCQELVYGVVRWQAALDWLIERKTAGRAQKPMLQILLRLGLYQIFRLDRVPDHAAVHETVEQARRSGFGAQSGFVNAVLRGYAREAEVTRQLWAELKSTEPHLGYSHPEWLVARWEKRWRRDQIVQLLEWNNTPPKTYARVNTLPLFRQVHPSREFSPATVEPGSRLVRPVKESVEEVLLAQWREEKVDGEAVRHDWWENPEWSEQDPINLVFELKSHPPLSTLPSFQQGLFYIQDPSTLLAVHLLGPRPGETILDLCAAPGGKTTCIAQLMRNQGRVVAQDQSPERIHLLRENCARLGADCVEIISPDGLDLRPATFDRILVDAPCSNTGVMRRRVDLRWRIRPEEISRLQAMQLELLRRAAPLLKQHGTLVYSTCSLEPEENQQVVEQFLREFPAFKLDHQRELLPFVDNVDGAFVARLVAGPEKHGG
jgi:16S rRNA (cytosine967-C5)-methyltransferase